MHTAAKFLSPFMRDRLSCPTRPSIASIKIPIAAPKNPPYTAIPSCMTTSRARGRRRRRSRRPGAQPPSAAGSPGPRPMRRPRSDPARLTRALAAKGSQPARSDVEPLFTLLATGDRDQAEAASRALARLGSDAATAALARFDAAPPVARARITRLVGRVAQKRGDRALAAWLVARVDDADDN